MKNIEHLITHIDRPGIDKDASLDIISVDAGLSLEDALRVQIGAKERVVKRGDGARVGYQASFTSEAAQKLVPGMPPPMVGSLLSTVMRPDNAVVAFDAEATMVECEIGIVLGRDLAGPHVTPFQASAAVEAYFPAIEVAPIRPGLLEGKWSNQHLIAVQKAEGGYVVCGSTLTSPRGFDPRLEAVLVNVDGKVVASGLGIEAMGSPANVLAAVANRLADAGEQLKAGQIVITGSISPPQPVGPANRVATAQFTRLGTVSVRFSAA